MIYKIRSKSDNKLTITKNKGVFYLLPCDLSKNVTKNNQMAYKKVVIIWFKWLFFNYEILLRK